MFHGFDVLVDFRRFLSWLKVQCIQYSCCFLEILELAKCSMYLVLLLISGDS